MKYQLLPPLNPGEYDALKEDIKERGIMVPVEIDEHGDVLDGHHRIQIAQELGIEIPVVRRTGLGTEQQKRTHARTMNLMRRHLNREMKRAVIADELRENPKRSNNSIAKLLGVSDNTVQSVRQNEGFDSEERVGEDGKTYKGGGQRKKTYVAYITFETEDDLKWWRRWVRETKEATGEKKTGAAIVEWLGGSDAD